MQLRHHLQHGLARTSPAMAAPWRSQFLSHVQEAPVFNLSTLHSNEQPFSAAGSSLAPRARTVVFRGMLGGMDVNPKNSAKLNPDTWESDLLTLTTDDRMEKVPELLGHSSSGQNHQSQSGRGGPVEAVFWVPKTKTQWRLRGHAYVIGPDIDTDAGAPVRKALEDQMRRIGDGPWSWGTELTAHFGNLSPTMRGSFRNPPPGRPVTEKPEEGYGLGQKVGDLEDEIARRHFRLLVIVPEDVDQVDLTDPDRGRRWNYQRTESQTWTSAELWP